MKKEFGGWIKKAKWPPFPTCVTSLYECPLILFRVDSNFNYAKKITILGKYSLKISNGFNPLCGSIPTTNQIYVFQAIILS